MRLSLPTPALRVATLIAALLVLVTLLAYQRSAAYLEGAIQLSASGAACPAVAPEAARNASATRLGAVWTQGGMDGGGICKNEGSAIARFSYADGSDLGEAWSDPVTIFAGSPTGACAVVSDVALHGTVAHIVTLVRQPCIAGLDPQATTLSYRTCALSGSPPVCNPAETAYALQSDVDGMRITDVSLTVDGAGHPHLAFSTVGASSTDAVVWYHRNLGGGWNAASPQQVSEPVYGSAGWGDVAYRPQIAWGEVEGEGRAHLVWETHEDQITLNPSYYHGEVRYSYCTASSCTVPETLGSGRGVGSNYDTESTYPTPALAASGPYVVVTWNNCQEKLEDFTLGNPPCTWFGLQYRRSTDGGTTFFLTREVATDDPITTSSGPDERYLSTDGYGSVGSTHEKFLRPAVTLDGGGLPYLAWHEHLVYTGIEPYGLWIAFAESEAGGEGLAWSPQYWQVDYDAVFYSAFYPALALAVPGGPHGVHLFYMHNSLGIDEPHHIYYHYMGSEDRLGQTATPTPTGSATGTATATPTPTATATNTPTPTPTATLEPGAPTYTATPTPSATATLEPGAPTYTATATATATPGAPQGPVVFLPLILKNTGGALQAPVSE